MDLVSWENWKSQESHSQFEAPVQAQRPKREKKTAGIHFDRSKQEDAGLLDTRVLPESVECLFFRLGGFVCIGKMVIPFITNPIYIYTSYIGGIYWV